MPRSLDAAVPVAAARGTESAPPEGTGRCPLPPLSGWSEVFDGSPAESFEVSLKLTGAP